MKTRLIRGLRATGLYFFARRLKLALYRHLPASLRDDALAVRFFSQFISSGDLVFDVGANVGIKTKIFRGLGARVVAVEPQQHLLREIRGVFGSDGDVVIVGKALSDSTGMARLHPSISNSGRSTMSAEFRERGRFAETEVWAESIDVPTTTLDALISLYGIPQYCKIDVEGFEDRVLAGLSSPIPLISFEFHMEMLEVVEKCMLKLSTLSRYGYDVTSVDQHHFDWGRWLTMEEAITCLRENLDPTFEGEIYARRLDG